MRGVFTGEIHLEKLHYNSDDYLIKQEPFYQPVGNEIDIFNTASNNGLPILIKGPTGCGKTRFVEFMAWRLNKPLIGVSCHDDLTTSDMLGRYLVRGGETVWIDGPLTSAVRAGGICYLDEFVEARKDTTVVIHSLRDGIHPFCITIDKEGEDYLPHMYGAVNYTIIDDVRKLPVKVSDIYRRLTA